MYLFNSPTTVEERKVLEEREGANTQQTTRQHSYEKGGRQKDSVVYLEMNIPSSTVHSLRILRFGSFSSVHSLRFIRFVHFESYTTFALLGSSLRFVLFVSFSSTYSVPLQTVNMPITQLSYQPHIVGRPQPHPYLCIRTKRCRQRRNHSRKPKPSEATPSSTVLSLSVPLLFFTPGPTPTPSPGSYFSLSPNQGHVFLLHALDLCAEVLSTNIVHQPLCTNRTS
jgi:hypothetical protein